MVSKTNVFISESRTGIVIGFVPDKSDGPMSTLVPPGIVEFSGAYFILDDQEKLYILDALIKYVNGEKEKVAAHGSGI